MKNNIFSFDAETNGLWGQAFSIGAVVTDRDGNEIDRFVARCPIDGDVVEFVRDNVLPEMASIKETHSNYKDMLSEFMAFYMRHKDNSDIIVHMGLPVEARLFLDARRLGIIGDWDAPYPLIDISAFPQIADSVDKYLSARAISVPDFDGGTHNPLYDSMAAALAYADVIS